MNAKDTKKQRDAGASKRRGHESDSGKSTGTGRSGEHFRSTPSPGAPHSGKRTSSRKAARGLRKPSGAPGDAWRTETGRGSETRTDGPRTAKVESGDSGNIGIILIAGGLLGLVLWIVLRTRQDIRKTGDTTQ